MAEGLNIQAYSDALVVLGTAGVIVPLLRRAGVSPVLGYLGAGALLGPLALGSFINEYPLLYWFTVIDAKSVTAIAELGVVFLLFLIGLELSFDRLKAMRRLVLGQPSVTVNQTVRSLVGWRRGWMPPVGLELSEWLIEGLIKLLRIEVNAWDRFSIRQRHFVHEPVSPPERFGLVSYAPTLQAVFETAGLPHR